MPTLKEIKAQIKSLPNTYIFYTQREIKYLPNIITDDEQILGLTSGFHGNKTVLLVCTNRRVIFVDKGMFFGLKVKQLNLDRIQSIDSSYTIMFGKIRMWDGAAGYEISMVYKDSIDPFVKAVRDAIQNFRRISLQDAIGAPQARSAPYAPANAAPQNDTLAELERLASLRERGHLSEAEFAREKQKLLNNPLNN